MRNLDQHELATLGGGCFWCTEAVFRDIEGVLRVVPGYAGGKIAKPSYEQVCGGATGHAEVIQVEFDPARIGYRDLLELFFASHDPTTPNRQGNDTGSQYRSIIFYHSDEQRRTAESLIAALGEARVFPQPIVTELAPAGAFYPAEAYHHDYYERNPNQPYCQVVIAPKLAKLRKHYAERLRR